MPDAASLASATPPALHGLIRLSGIAIAIPAAAIREVIPRPEELLPFPALIPEVSGAISLRGQVIPVLNLERLLHPSRDGHDDSGKIVVVLRHGNQIHGIEAESIEGVTSLANDDLGEISIAGGAPAHQLITSTFVHGSMSGVVVDPAALASLSGLPLACDLAGEARDRQKVVEPTLIFRIGALRYALPAAWVDASLPVQRLLPAPVPDELWIAMLRHNRAEIPVVDTLALLQQGSLGDRSSGSAVVLRTRPHGRDSGEEFGLAALLIDSVEDIVRLEPGRTAALEGDLKQTPFVTGIVDLDCGPCLMLDGARLASDPRLMKLGSVRQEPQHEAGPTIGADSSPNCAADTEQAAPEPFLVFAVGKNSFAAPLMEIDEILLHDEALIPLESDSHAILGLLSRRGRTVPILDLAQCLGEERSASDRFLVIARLDNPGSPNRVGFAVDALRSVDKAVAQKLGGKNGTRKAPSLGLLELTIRLEDGQACSVLDLPQLALDRLGQRQAA